MQIQKIKLKDLPLWPPVWTCWSMGPPQEGVLRNVEVVPGTELLKIDVEHARKTCMGIMLTEADVLNILFRKLKANIGRPLAEIKDLEINLEINF